MGTAIPLLTAILIVAATEAAASSSLSPKKPTYHIGAMFPNEHFLRLFHTFNQTMKSLNQRRLGVQLGGVAFPDLHTPTTNFLYVCDAFHNRNITLFFVIGNQHTINAISLVTRYTGIPLIAYNTDWNEASAVQGERVLQLDISPSQSSLAYSMLRVMRMNQWQTASLLTEDTRHNDVFTQTLLREHKKGRWKMTFHSVMSLKDTRAQMLTRLRAIREQSARILLLHCSVTLARKIFQVAAQAGLLRAGYAWLLSEDAVSTNPKVLMDYPTGLLMVSLYRYNDLRTVVREALTLAARGIQRVHRAAYQKHGNDSLNIASAQGCNHFPSKSHFVASHNFYRYLKKTHFVTRAGKVSFSDDGRRRDAPFRISNLQQDLNGIRSWKTIGAYRKGPLRLETVLWPGGTLSGPVLLGEQTLRVATTVVPPFVSAKKADNWTCSDMAMVCLKVNTKMKEELERIFSDYESRRIMSFRKYSVHCCQGLSIKLLEQIGRDLKLQFQLYIVADLRYGDRVEGKWNGLVEDLRLRNAHMAIGAFSVTLARSEVIDFTYPYFHSGFSILVSERKRATPIYAFLEPFDSLVWVSIVLTATVVAVALSLLEWNSPFGLNPWGRKRKTNYSLGSGLNMVWAILFQHTVKTKSPKAWPSKWVQNFWAGASIFIYSSYTANLAAFLAGKNSGVTVSGIHDSKLLEPGHHVGVIRGTSVEDAIKKFNGQLLAKAIRFDPDTRTEAAVALLINETIDAYFDDTAIVEHARRTMDSLCRLRIIGDGFGDDGYGIGLPKGSWLKDILTKRILEYHENGFLEELRNLYYRRSLCTDPYTSEQLQGKVAPMVFQQHAGLYLLLVVGIVLCFILIFVEHATFKWMVPFWRSKPGNSFWKSLSMMFWSQRLYRIITSEELISPHHTAKEMLEVVRNRDFTKLFQKSVKKQELRTRNRKNLFNVVEQLQWKQRREDRLNQGNPGDPSMDSDNSATPLPDTGATTDEGLSEDSSSKAKPQWRRDLGDSTDEEGVEGRLAGGHRQRPPLYKLLSSASYNSKQSTPLQLYSKHRDDPFHSDDELLDGQERHDHASDSDKPDSPLLHRRNSRPTSSSAENISAIDSLQHLVPTCLPNGVLILSPNGDAFAQTNPDMLYPRRNLLPLKPQTSAFPVSERRSNYRRRQTLGYISPFEKTEQRKSDISSVNLEKLSKQEIYFMWKMSDRELNSKLKKVTQEKNDLLSGINGEQNVEICEEV